MKEFKGIIPAFYACYDDLGQISEERTRKLVNYFIDNGVDGLYVNGSSGECIYLSVPERKKILEYVVEENKGRVKIIAHVACNSTADSMKLAKHAEMIGVDAIAAIPPIYFKLPDHAVKKYWEDIASAAPYTDFFIYNIPQLAGVSLNQNLLQELIKNPRVVGVKNSSMPTADIQMWKLVGGENFVVLNGPDEQLIAGLAQGADGGIGGTYGVMPMLYKEMYQRFNQNDIMGARKIQDECSKIIYQLCSKKANMYAMIKEVLRQGGLDLGPVRSPLYDISDTDEIELAKTVYLKIQELISKYV